jgi:uncharacterized membrane protein YdjX (TVP38/TMEM64 family)
MTDWSAVIDSLIGLTRGLELTPVTAVSFGLFCIASAMLFIPRPIVCTSAGFLLGGWSAPIAWLCLTAGAALAFLFARYLARDMVQSWVARSPWRRTLMQAVEDEGWRVIVLLRLGSPMPSSLQSYFYGVTQVSLRTFTLATFFGIAPSVFVFTIIGAAARNGVEHTSSDGAWLTVAAVSTLLVMLLLGRRLYAGRASIKSDS